MNKKENSKNQPLLKIGQRFYLTIKRLGINGEGIGYYKKKIVFVPNALPDEVIVAQLTQIKPKYLEAKIRQIKQKSPYRVKPKDAYDVGGIELAHLAYDKQLEFKRDIIIQALEKFKPQGYQKYLVKETLGMDNPYEYRNKAQFQVQKNQDGQVIAGLYKPNSHILVDLPTFCTQRPLTMKIMRTLCQILTELDYSIYNEKKHQGCLKTIVVRESLAKHNAQVVFVTKDVTLPKQKQLLQAIAQQLPEVVSVMQNINPAKTSLIWGEETRLLAGSDHLVETLGEITFKLSARAFFQLNPLQTKVLYDEVKQALDLQVSETLVDAYCGVGTIGLYVGQEAKKILGMDVIAEAIADAKQNASQNGITNAHYETGTAEEILPKWNKQGFISDALIVDPPRTGLDDKLLKTILQYPPKKLVYVSCNASTLARDLVELTKKYRVKYLQPIDMFPQTARTECVVKLEYQGVLSK